jgi:SAM-dependent methyltransferase
MRRVYGPLCTEFYDLDKPEPPAAALAYYLARAHAANGPVLEPMCGSGRFLLPLLAAGIDVDGIDASAEMLAACRRHAAARGLAPSLHAAALERLALPRRYALAFVASGSIGLLGHGDALDGALVRLREHLAPGGTLLVCIDEPGAEPIAADSAPRIVHAADGSEIRYVARATAMHDAVRYDGRYERRRGGVVVEREAETLTVALHAAGAFAARLGAAGLTGAHVVADAPDPVLLECRAPAAG